ncbi:MAG: hypothetical protein WC528_04690 [Patescibacteria group bacterium]
MPVTVTVINGAISSSVILKKGDTFASVFVWAGIHYDPETELPYACTDKLDDGKFFNWNDPPSPGHFIQKKFKPIP